MTSQDTLLTTKRRRLLDPCDFGRSTGGFVDNCRVCGVQIIRKGQSRPRICLPCEKKKATPIEDVCKDCREPIVRSNVRKARICQKCKKTRERTKSESILGPSGYAYSLPPGYSAARKVYSAKNRLQFLSQYQQLSEALYHYGYPIPQQQWFTDEGNMYDSNCSPPFSGLSKIDTDQFGSPEEIVEYLLQRQHVKAENVEPKCKQNQTPILIPHINPFEVRDLSSPCVPTAVTEEEYYPNAPPNGRTGESQFSKTQPIVKTYQEDGNCRNVRIKSEPDENANNTSISTIGNAQWHKLHGSLISSIHTLDPNSRIGNLEFHSETPVAASQTEGHQLHRL